MTVPAFVPVRRGSGPLHIAAPTGRGYRTICGHTLEGAKLEVPRPRFPSTRAGLERYWERIWGLELVCRKCERVRVTL